MYGAGRKPNTELMLTMRPLPWRRMWGRTARVIRTIPKKFVSKIARACSIELSSAPAGATLKPALFTRRSTRPSDRSRAFTAAATDSSLVTSRESISNERWPGVAPRQAPKVRRAATRRIKEMIDVVARHSPDQGDPGVYEHALVTVATMVGALVLA